jgi:diguanylate cyclase (GGDEF)-like protein
MKNQSAGSFGNRKKDGAPARSKTDIKTILFISALVIFLYDASGFYPKFQFHPAVHLVLYAIFFIIFFLLQKYSSRIGEHGQNRLTYGLGLLYLTLICVSGGVTSPLKWTLIALSIMLYAERDFKKGSIILSALILGLIRDFPVFTIHDIFALVCGAGAGVLFYFMGLKKEEHADASPLKRIETEKESAHFKIVIYDLMESLLEIYHDVLKPVSILLFMKNDDAGGVFTLTMSVSKKEDEIIKDYSFDLKEGVLGSAVNKNSFFNFDIKGVRMPYYRGKVEPVCAVTMPIFLNKMIGVIALDFERDIEPEKENIRQTLNELSGQIVSILELFDINQKAISKEERVSRMYEINEKMNMMEGKSGLMTGFLNEIRSFDIYSGYLAEYNQEDKSFEVTETLNYPAAAKGVKFSLKDNKILGYIIDTGKPIIIDDAAKKNIDLNFNRLNIDKAFIGLLKNGGSIYGFIKLDKEKGHTFADFEVKTIEMMLSGITIMLENARLYDKIKKQAFHDGLTGLLNHLTFQEKLRESIEKCGRGVIRTVSLCILDIDFFKKFNDSFGHQEGDRVLKKIAGMLTEFEHKYERTYCARYGGEEFVFVMENYSINEAVNIAEEIRKYAEENLKGGNEKEKRPVLVSIGVTSYPEFARDPRELFKNSDEALYLAKEEGRNRVKSILDVKKTDRRKR